MGNKRFRNVDWVFPVNDAGQLETWQQVEVALLMDIRDELQKLNSLLFCTNFTGLPFTMKQIEKNTRKRKPKNEAARKTSSR